MLGGLRRLKFWFSQPSRGLTAGSRELVESRLFKNGGLALSLLLLTGFTHADTTVIYKQTDAYGNASFSDQPSPGAKEITLPKIPIAPPTEDVIQSSSPIPLGVQDKGIAYKKITIVQPEEQLTVRNPQGYVSVVIELKPLLRKGDKIQIIFDGVPLGEPEANVVFALNGINRGAHIFLAEVIDSKGKVMITSEARTFYMMPPRVNMGQ